MVTCGGLKHIFEKPFSENSTILDSPSSWNQIKSMKPIKDSSFTEIFEESHFKDNISESSVSSFSSNNLPPLSSSSSTCSSYSNSFSFSLETIHQSGIEGKNRDPIYPQTSLKKHYKHSDSFSSRNSDSLSLCTEGLGFESSDDVEDLMNDLGNEEIIRSTSINYEYSKIRSRTNKGSLLPPPISCIGRNGKPWVSFESFRENGRFILKEVRIPEWEFLHACREDGRLKLHIVQSDDEFLEEDEEYDDDGSEDVEEDESSEEVTNDDDDDDDEKKRENGESC
ncbi:protein FAF-like, chloroplastic [Lycium barbarum]|uniref:protein FAF-like, chloroplastic n=1 Tax=Lycium barbarum TaxID=112863 RepID=UPI00293F19E0|nr:protein FAF-like, chloroplastic [Lycium barbarum]